MSDNTDFTPIFVYGTLKQGQPNANVLKNKDNGTCLSYSEYHKNRNNQKIEFKTINKYPLVVDIDQYDDEDGDYPPPKNGERFYLIPFMINDTDHELAKNIVGEVYYVDKKMRDFLDYFEGHPDWYVRSGIRVQSLLGAGMSKRKRKKRKILFLYLFFISEFLKIRFPRFSDYNNYSELLYSYLTEKKRKKPSKNKK